jgi:hypothetical protein
VSGVPVSTRTLLALLEVLSLLALLVLPVLTLIRVLLSDVPVLTDKELLVYEALSYYCMRP